MSEPFIGEIKLMSFAFPPKGWALCNGQLLAINQNQALFSLLGTTYGGNGQTTFALPNLQGRVPIGFSNSYPLGVQAGEAAHTVNSSELPLHVHQLVASTSAATTDGPNPNVVLSTSVGAPAYGAAQSLVPMDPGSLANTGGSQPHENLQPYLTLTFCIALVGIFPSRS